MEIDNELAIEMLKTFRQAMDTPITNYRDILLGSLDKAIKALENEKPKGEWIETEFGSKCPFCEVINVSYYRNFCPNCGAEMGGLK